MTRMVVGSEISTYQEQADHHVLRTYTVLIRNLGGLGDDEGERVDVPATVVNKRQ